MDMDMSEREERENRRELQLNSFPWCDSSGAMLHACHQLSGLSFFFFSSANLFEHAIENWA